jgi:hypothetical protein
MASLSRILIEHQELSKRLVEIDYIDNAREILAEVIRLGAALR